MPHGSRGHARVDRVISETCAELAARKKAELTRARRHERIALRTTGMADLRLRLDRASRR